MTAHVLKGRIGLINPAIGRKTCIVVFVVVALAPCAALMIGQWTRVCVQDQGWPECTLSSEVALVVGCLILVVNFVLVIDVNTLVINIF